MFVMYNSKSGAGQHVDKSLLLCADWTLRPKKQ